MSDNPLDDLFCRNGTSLDHYYYLNLEEKLGGVLARVTMSEKTAGLRWVKGHFRSGKYVPGYKREEEEPKVEEFAPGLPEKGRTTALPTVAEGSSRIWEFGVHEHHATRAGKHYDLRLGDPDTGIAHSWAVPRALLPKAGDKPVLAVMQPDHTVEYMDFKGMIREGYGKGVVKLPMRGKTEIISSGKDEIRFNLYKGRDINEYILRRTNKDKPDQWLLQNVTPIRSRRPDLPSSKPKYKEIDPKKVDFTKEDEVVQAKMDGAHVLVDMKPGKQTRVFSFRPTERQTGVIDHTQRIPGIVGHRGDRETGNTILRGEVYATDKRTGKALPAQTTGGILNSEVWKSRLLQEEKGPLSTALFDVVKHKGKKVEDAPYSEKLKILREIVARDSDLFHLPDMAETQEEKEKLFKDIQEGKHKQTSEGVIVWDKNKPGPTKAKHRPDFDVYVRKIYPGYSKGGSELDRAGGFDYSWSPDGPIVGRVGSGFNHKLLRDMKANPDKYIGRAAKVRSQERMAGKGALRSPSFSEWHLDKGKEGEGRRFFHGSPTPGLAVLEPRKDPRTGRKALFVDTKVHSPEIFSLMPKRHEFSKSETTRGGEFVKGEVVGKLPLGEVGYVYEVEAAPDSVVERKPGRFVLTAPAKVVGVRKVTKDEVLSRGWKVKTAGSKLRELVHVVRSSDPYAPKGSWDMVLRIPDQVEKVIGRMRMKAGKPTHIDHVALNELRGLGLGKKFYGEAMRRVGRLRSDRTVSQDAARVWEGMKGRKGYKVWRNPGVAETRHGLQTGLSKGGVLNPGLGRRRGGPVYSGELPSAARIKVAGVWTPSKIHTLADKMGVAWDDDPKFKRFSEKVTGVSCIDKMGPAQRKALANALISGGGKGLNKKAGRDIALHNTLSLVSRRLDREKQAEGLNKDWALMVKDVGKELAQHGYKLRILPDMKSYAAQDEKNKIILLAMRRRGVPVSFQDALWSAYHDLGHVIDGRSDDDYLQDVRGALAHEIECDRYGLERALGFMSRHGLEHTLSEDSWRTARYSTPKHVAEWLENLGGGARFKSMDRVQSAAIARALGLAEPEVDDTDREAVLRVIQSMIDEVLRGKRKVAEAEEQDEDPAEEQPVGLSPKEERKIKKKIKRRRLVNKLHSISQEREEEDRSGVGVTPSPNASESELESYL